MNQRKNLKLFEINFSDSQQEDNQSDLLSCVSRGKESVDVNVQGVTCTLQVKQQIQQIKNIDYQQKLQKQKNQYNRSNKEAQENNFIFQIDFNLSNQEISPSKYYFSQKKVERLPKSIKNSNFLLKSPFILQSNKNYGNKQHKILQRHRKVTIQRKKIQKFNQSFGTEGLEQIKLQAFLKRSDTSTTQRSLIDKQSKKQIQQQNQLIDKIQEQNQKIQILKCQDQLKNSQNNEIFLQQDNNCPPLFRHFRSFSFDSQSSQSQEVQQRYDEKSNQQESLESEDYIIDGDRYSNDLKNKIYQPFNIFSEKFSQEKYKQTIKSFLSKLLISSTCSQINQNQDYLKSNNVQNIKLNENIKRFLTTQIPQNYMFQFEVHVYKDLLKTQYQLWIKPYQNCDEKILIANAQKDTFHIDKSTFIINMVNHKNQKEFIGQLESNFIRDFYSLHGYHQLHEDLQNNYHRLSYEVREILNMSFTVDRVAYLPKFSENNQSVQDKSAFSCKQTSLMKSNQNLKQKYQNDKFTHSNTTYKLVHSRNFKIDQLLNRKLGIRESKKTILMQNGTNHDKLLFIGKIASKKYKLMVGQGISPLQAFGTIISHVEVN